MKATIIFALAALAVAAPQGNRGGQRPGPRGSGYDGGRPRGWEGPRGPEGPRGGGPPPSGPWPISVPYGYPGSGFLEGIGEGIGEQVGYCIATPWNCYTRTADDSIIFDLQPEAKQRLLEAATESEAPQQESA